MIVLDTSFLAGLYNTNDAHNAAARAYRQDFAEQSEPAVLLEYIFLETMNVLLQRSGYEAARRAGQVLLGSDDIAFVRCSSRFASAWADFAAQTGTRLSLTDIAIVEFALEHAEGRVLSFDQEFRKMPGITLLPEGR